MPEGLGEQSMRCVLCEPAPHENCEVWGSIQVEDVWGEYEGEVPVCLEHYEAVADYLTGVNRDV